MVRRRVGLVIGNNYPNLEIELKCAVADANKMTEILLNKNICSFDDVVTLVDKTSREISIELIKLFRNAHEEDTIFIYFAGHGKTDSKNNLRLLFDDIEEEYLIATSLPFDFINDCRNNSPALKATVVVVLDCCYSSSAEIRNIDLTESFSNCCSTGMVILTSTGSTGSRFARENKVFGHGIFTYYLIEGLEKGLADEDYDGFISIDDLYKYAYNNTKKVSQQSPQKKGSIEGTILIGRNPQRIREKEYELKKKKLMEEFSDLLPSDTFVYCLSTLRKYYKTPSQIGKSDDIIYTCMELLFKDNLSPEERDNFIQICIEINPYKRDNDVLKINQKEEAEQKQREEEIEAKEREEQQKLHRMKEEAEHKQREEEIEAKEREEQQKLHRMKEEAEQKQREEEIEAKEREEQQKLHRMKEEAEQKHREEINDLIDLRLLKDKKNLIANKKLAIKDVFYSAFEFIEKDDSYHLCHAIITLGGIVEIVINDFFDTYIQTFSQEEFKKIVMCKNKVQYKNRDFDKFTLGQKMTFLRDSAFIEKIGIICHKNFANTLKLRDSEFVAMRNRAIHDNIGSLINNKCENNNFPNSDSFSNLSLGSKENSFIIDKDNTINQLNLIADVLSELGYEEKYDYDNIRCNIFYDYFRSISDKYVNEFTLPFSYNYTFDTNLLSDFQNYNHNSGKFEQFNFIEESKYANSECLTKCNCMIFGEGGIGKSTILFQIYEYCKHYNINFMKRPIDNNTGHGDFCPIPIFISAHKFKISDFYDYTISDLKNDIAEQVGCDIFLFFEEAEKMAHLYNKTDSNKPFFIFLIDGLNETTIDSNYFGKKVLNLLSEFIEKRIQVVVTSRTNIQPDEIFYNKFKEIRAVGLTRNKIIEYIKKQNPAAISDINSKFNNRRIFDILKNPMLLTLYTGYKYGDKELEKFSQEIEKLKRESKLNIRETNTLCISDIFWNYIEYNFLFHNIFQPVIEMQSKKLNEREKAGLKRKICEQKVHLKVISELIPQIAWELVSQDLFSIKISDDRLRNIMENFYEKNETNHYIEKDEAINGILEYMTNSICLLKWENGILSFHNQNFRDFFAACHYISEYMLLTGICDKKTDKIRENLRNEYLSSNLKLFVGELLNERGVDLQGTKINLPLQELLSQYRCKDISDDLTDHTVENIFEIDKSLDVLNLNDYFDLNIDRLNFNDVKADNIVYFVDKMLYNVSIYTLMPEGVLNKIKKKLLLKNFSDAKNVDMLQKLFMLSVRCASNSNKKYIEKIFDIWFIWVKKIYKKDILTKKLISNVISNLLHSYLKEENVGIGEKGILSVFNDISNSKPMYMSLSNVLRDPFNVNISEIVDKTYDLASECGLASNFTCSIINYYIYKNRNNNFGVELINELMKKMNVESNKEKKTFIRFRLMSSINFCLQESLLDSTFTEEDLNKFKSIFKPIMFDLLNDELNGFSYISANDYKDLKYGYYFPFGILYAFDDGVNEKFDIERNRNLMISQIFESIFTKDIFNYNLFQKLIFDVAVISTSTYFVQNLEYLEDNRERSSDVLETKLYGCNYLENTYTLFNELILKLYPIDQASSPYEKNNIIWISLVEAMSILYYNFPMKTEVFFDSLNAHYMNRIKSGKDHQILHLRQKSAETVNKKFEQLCKAKLRGNTFIIKDFIINYKNMWLFANLSNNVFLTYENIRESFVSWGENSFYKNIDLYQREPEEFVKQTLKEIFFQLDIEE